MRERQDNLKIQVFGLRDAGFAKTEALTVCALPFGATKGIGGLSFGPPALSADEEATIEGS